MDKTVRIWDIAGQQNQHILEKHTDHVYCVKWSPDGRRLASGSFDKDILIWETETWNHLKTLKGHNGYGIASLLWYGDDQLVSGGAYNDQTIRLWDIESGECLKVLRGHNQAIQLTWANRGQKLISASLDRTIRVWSTESWQPENILEGHIDEVVDVSAAASTPLFASKSVDGTLKLWHTNTLVELAEIEESTSTPSNSGLAFHPHLPYLATLGAEDKVIRIWEIDSRLLMPQSDAEYDTTTRYTTAKLILVGDSGVGKTGLGWRLAHNEFKEQSSTHGQQFWPIPDLGLTLEDGTQCEAVLWDLAGQPIYGQVHALFLDNIDTALILFDPTTRLEPLKGVTTWIENLKGKDKLPPSILVGARTDRGQPTLSREELDKFCQEKGITGGYISTSAVDGSGIDELFERLSVLIPWEEMVTTVTTRTFKRIKDYILALKEKPNGHSVLVNARSSRSRF
jgi:small GTP-binding protein